MVLWPYTLMTGLKWNYWRSSTGLENFSSFLKTEKRPGSYLLGNQIRILVQRATGSFLSLTNYYCKLMKKLILKKLNFYLNSNDLLPSEQYNFRRGHSTTDQILYFGQNAKNSQNLKPSGYSIAVFWTWPKH